MIELWRLGAAELADAYAAGGATSTEVVEACLDRVAALDPVLGAFTYIDRDGARVASAAATEELRSGLERSALHGVPFGVKEIFEVASWPHTAGSLAWSGRVGQSDSDAVRLLRAAGAIPVGLTRSHEFAMGVTTQHEKRGSTRNPWSHDRVPGGSSGGSAAAVAAGLVPLALGSDTSGSARIPAALCGIVGFRPTHGLISLRGVVPLAPSFDAVGVMAREVEEVQAAMEILSPGWTRGAPKSDLSGVRVGVPVDFVPPVGLAQSEAVEVAAAKCSELGATLVPVALPSADEIDAALDAQRAEMIHTHTEVLKTWPAHREALSASLQSRLGGLVSRGADAAAGEEARSRIRAAVAAIAADLVLSPVVAKGPSSVADPEAGDFRDSSLRCNHLQSLAGVPALSLPVGLDEEGLPAGVQVWGHQGEDAAVLVEGAMMREALRDRLPEWPPELVAQ
ncbi:MAG: amidase [Actinobacteria bacterium]|nr:amidase [Actinomycetota bacterium]